MRKWLIGLGLVLAIVLVLCFLVVFDVYNQRGSTDDVAVATFDDVDVNPFLDCPFSKIELRNKRDIPLDLDGWKVGFPYGVSYRIPAKTIVAPGDSIIVSRILGKDGSFLVESLWSLKFHEYIFGKSNCGL